MDYGDTRALRSWLLAHDQRHRVERQAIVLAKGIPLPNFDLTGDPFWDWQQNHATMHEGMLRFVTPDQTVSAQVLNYVWDDEGSFYWWHSMHNKLHAELDAQLGIR